MTSLRLLLILLLVLNILAFAALRGWLGNLPAAGVPDRVASQLEPQRIRLESEGAAPLQAMAEPVNATPAPLPDPSAPVRAALEPLPAPPDPAAAPLALLPAAAEARPGDASPPAVCHVWANLTAAQADQLDQRLRRVGATPIPSRTETPDSWWVRIPPQVSQAEAERRIIELKLLGVVDTFIIRESGPTQYAVSLGVFKTETRARMLLDQLRARGVSDAAIEPRMSTTYRIQASLLPDELPALESAVAGLRGQRQRCAAP